MLRLASLALSALLASCSSLGSSDTGLSGSLVIAGGGMSSRSLEVREAFLARRVSGDVGVIGAASSGPEASAARGVRAMNEAAGAEVAVALPFNASEPELADDPALAAKIDGCGALWFTGGSQSRIVEAMRPGGRETLAWRACVRLLERGGVIGGSSAGAAMMCDPMIRRGRSANAMREGVGPEGVDVGAGMGFFPWGLVDQHFLERGRFGRLVVALGETGGRLGWGISEDSAIVVDRTTGWAEVIGSSGLALFDMRELQVSEGRWEGVGLSLLSSGDRVNALTGEVVATSGSTARAPLGEPERALVMEGLFNAEALRQAVHQLIDTHHERALLRDGEEGALLRRGANARAWVRQGASGAEQMSAAGLLLDLYRITE